MLLPIHQMGWPLAILLGIINAIFCGAATIYLADVGASWHKVSSFEGGRGFLVVFFWLPIGFLLGFLIGLLVSRSRPYKGFLGTIKSFCLSIFISAFAMGLAMGGAWITADHAPTIDGKELELEYEVRLPPGYPLQTDFEKNELRIGLVVSNSDRNYSTIEFSKIEKRDGFTIVPGHAHLNTTVMGRNISVTYGPWAPHSDSTQFIEIPLAAAPSKSDMQWSNWVTAQKRFDLSEVQEEIRVQVRYRVVLSE